MSPGCLVLTADHGFWILYCFEVWRSEGEHISLTKRFFEMLYLLGLWRERMSHEDRSFIHLSMHRQQSSEFRDALCKNNT
jgi:hypothetical protein